MATVGGMKVWKEITLQPFNSMETHKNLMTCMLIGFHVSG